MTYASTSAAAPRHIGRAIFVTLLTLVPLAAATNRFVRLSDPATAVEPITERFSGDYRVLIAHIVFGVLFAFLALHQFSPRTRQRRLPRHRGVGRVAAVFGLIGAVTGQWLIAGFPISPLATPFGNSVRFGFALLLGVAIVLSLLAIRRRDIARHRAWMIRAFAIGVAGSTQAVLIGLWSVATGHATASEIAVLLTFGFLINMLGAEFFIRRPLPATAL